MDAYFKKIKKRYTSGQPGKVVDALYFYYDTAPDYNKDLAIVCGGYEKCSPDFDINRNDYPYYFVKYTISGKGTLEIDSKTLQLRSGILTGFQPGTAHHYKADPNEPMEHVFITFVGTKASELFKKSTLNKKHFIETTENGKEMLDICYKILDIGIKKPAFSQEICCNYLCILMMELAACPSNLTANISISLKTYNKCKSYIDSDFSLIRTPCQVAEKCGIDTRYMANLFKKYGHISPSDYLTSLKMNKAANLLLTTDLKVKDVAKQVGFKDQYHFSKSFKQFHNISPNHYRFKHMQRNF